MTFRKSIFGLLVVAVSFVGLVDRALSVESCYQEPCKMGVGCAYNNEGNPCTCPSGTVKTRDHARDLYSFTPGPGMKSYTSVFSYACVGGEPTSSKGRQNNACSTPPAGTTVNIQGVQCIVAANTNSLPQCKYQFQYSSSIVKGVANGPVVDPGKTDSTVCGRPGESLQFSHWLPPAGTGR
jgi:hypothetical protein